jgi:hypothetical protein
MRVGHANRQLANQFGFLILVLRAHRNGEMNAVSRRQLLSELAHSDNSAFVIAIYYAELGERDRTMAYLEKAYENRDSMLLLNVWPSFELMHSDPRFQELVRRVGLPQ